MEIEKKHTSNINEPLTRRYTPKSWSDLPQDLLHSVFERLSFANFQRAKSVCSSWHSASTQCVPNNQIPWLILFPEEDNNSSCKLFNPEEKDKLYRTQDLGLEFTKSFCIQTYGSWLLMRNRHDLYIMNLFTLERINLPPVESQLGMTKIERTLDDKFRIARHNGEEYKGIITIRSPVFWIDEKTKDYVVIWELRELCVVYSRKRDTSWNQIPETSSCCDLVYKDSMLYFLGFLGWFRIFDFSGEIPQQTFRCCVTMERFPLGIIRLRQLSNFWSIVATKLVVTMTGEVLKVEKLRRGMSQTWSFRVFKVYSSGFLKNQNLINSLGDEAMLLDQGITVLANDNDGFIRNSIYFSVSHGNMTHNTYLFNLETRKTELLHEFDCSSAQFSRARWFLPKF